MNDNNTRSTPKLYIIPLTMSEIQAQNITEGANTGDVEDEVQPTAKSAEDRKAAAALSSLDARKDEESSTKDIDHEAVRQAMDRLSGLGGSGTEAKKKELEKKEVKKVVKVDAADVALVVCATLSLWIYIHWETIQLDFYKKANLNILDRRTRTIENKSNRILEITRRRCHEGIKSIHRCTRIKKFPQ